MHAAGGTNSHFLTATGGEEGGLWPSNRLHLWSSILLPWNRLRRSKKPSSPRVSAVRCYSRETVQSVSALQTERCRVQTSSPPPKWCGGTAPPPPYLIQALSLHRRGHVGVDAAVREAGLLGGFWFLPSRALEEEHFRRGLCPLRLGRRGEAFPHTLLNIKC